MRFLLPKTEMGRALYRARHVYRLGYKRLGRPQYIVLQGSLVLLLIGAGLAPAIINTLQTGTVHADGTTISGGAPVAGRVNQQIAISDLSIGGTGDDTLPVKLTASNGSLWLGDTDGLTFTGDTTGSTLTFSGARSAINTDLATLHYVSASVGTDTVEMSLASSQEVFDSDNGHVYEYIGGDYTWWDAKAAADASTYDGLQGYLATITSPAENSFIETKLSGNAWLGASDDPSFSTTEGHWKWVDGPENGDNFCNNDNNCIPVDSSYVDWAGGEPNNSGDDENCMETYISDGTWNDLPCDDAGNGYVVEYGAPGHLASGIPTKDISVTTTAATFGGGDGSAGAPYQITDCERLQDLNQDLTAHYVLTHDIDCTDTPNWNGGQGFLPIGYDGTPFTGTFNGGGYNIVGLTEIRADDDVNTNFGTDPATNQQYIGLFGETDGATISDTHLTSAMIKGYMYVGGIVGYMNGGTLSGSSVNTNISQPDGDCTTHQHCVWARYGYYGGGLVGWMEGGTVSDSETGGPVKGSGHVIGGLVGFAESGAEIDDSSSSSPIDAGENTGGAVGEADDTTLNNVSASGSVISTLVDEDVKFGENAGGLIGSGSSDTISHSRASGSVHADNYYAGGLFGALDSSDITDSYATGDVYSDTFGGGLAGNASGDTFARTYASGAVDGNSNLGGLFGEMGSNTVNDSFATGAVTSSDTVGGIVGGDNGNNTLSQTYFDATSTGQSDCSGGGTMDGCTAITQAGYFLKKSHIPFTQAGSQVWLGTVWDFDGTHLPVFGTSSDDDDDGISTAVENAAPNNGDANNDGTADDEQDNVAALVDPLSGHYTAVAVDSTCDLSNVSVEGETSLLSSDNSYNYPLGLLNFTADCGTPGFTTTVTQYYYNPPSGTFTLRKFVNGTYQTVPGATLTRQVIGGQPVLAISYSVKDGGSLDSDGTANGVIVDPAGPALAESSSSTLTDTGENIALIAGIATSFVLAAILVKSRKAHSAK